MSIFSCEGVQAEREMPEELESDVHGCGLKLGDSLAHRMIEVAIALQHIEESRRGENVRDVAGNNRPSVVSKDPPSVPIGVPWRELEVPRCSRDKRI